MQLRFMKVKSPGPAFCQAFASIIEEEGGLLFREQLPGSYKFFISTETRWLFDLILNKVKGKMKHDKDYSY